MLQNLILIGSTIILVVVAVNIHLIMLKVLAYIGQKVVNMKARHIVSPVLIAMVAHTLEIIVFAGGMFALERTGNYGHLATSGDGLFTDFVYLSAVTYTTLGFGDITLVGPLRFLVGVESLTGLVLSAWTASVIFVAVQRLGLQLEKELNP